MGKINLLETSVVNMIAAGEVVERPASVVKELLENSIDANSTNITVEIKNGGMSYIRITDNGTGIEPDDLKNAILPHATSKLKDASDLAKIFTLGFRGEALSSICAVANVEIYTKTKNSQMGRMICVKGGEVIEETDAGCADGTTVIVRNLFYNTPARMKFLKRDATECAYVTDVVNKIILGNPDISIKYISGSFNVSAPGDKKIESAIYSVYGREYLKDIIPVNYTDDNMTVSGVIGNQSLAKKNRTYQSFFINGRSIFSKTMSQALQEAFANSIMTGRFPFAVLNIKLNPTRVDVNVHPTKMQVRFSDEKKIFDIVYFACKNALLSKKYIPEMTSKKQPTANDVKQTEYSNQSRINLLKDSFVKDKESYIKENVNIQKSDEVKLSENAASSVKDNENPPNDKKETSFTSFDILNTKNVKEDVLSSLTGYNITSKTENRPVKEVKKETDKKETADTTSDYKENNNCDLKNDVDFKIIGQIFETYIIVQKGTEVIIIDQHAAHERMYFEKFIKDFKERKISSQILLMPVTLDLSSSDFANVSENIEIFLEMGFEIEQFGKNAVIVRKIPCDSLDIPISDLIVEMADTLSKRKADNISERSMNALHTMACKKALKGNRVLNMAEMEDLVKRVFEMESINTCPHGRPIEIKMTKTYLEKQFKRIV